MSDSSYDAAQVIEAVNSGPALNAVSNFTATVTGVSSNLVIFNTKRVFVIIQNLSGVLYVKLGTGAALNSYSFQLAPLQMVSIDRWNGVISAVSDSSSNVVITEVS